MPWAWAVSQAFLTRATGGVTSYCIRVRKDGKAERGARERCEVVANEERGSWGRSADFGEWEAAMWSSAGGGNADWRAD
jgi:hypothetical protein